METIYIPIYARKNESGIVVDIFSETFANTNGRGGIKSTDILINAENTEYGGERNYPLVDSNGFYNYAIINNKLVERDKTADLAHLLAEVEIAQLQEKLKESDYKVLKYAEGFITESDYNSIKLERQSWRNRINELRGRK